MSVDSFDPREAAAKAAAAKVGFDAKQGRYVNPPYYDQGATGAEPAPAKPAEQAPVVQDGGAIKWPQEKGARNKWVDHG